MRDNILRSSNYITRKKYAETVDDIMKKDHVKRNRGRIGQGKILIQSDTKICGIKE